MMGRLFLLLLLGCGIIRPMPVSPQVVSRSVYKVEFSGEFVDEADPFRQSILLAWTGTAWVVRYERDRSFLMTAGHVCVMEGGSTVDKGPPRRGFDVSKVRYVLVAADGTRYPGATALADDDALDLCLLVIPGNLGTPLPLADEDPPYSAEGYYIGAPHGLWGGGIAGYYATRFSGRGTPWLNAPAEALAFSTAEGAGGASGSPLVFKGRVVALYNFLAQGFGTFSTGVPHEVIRGFLQRSMPRG